METRVALIGIIVGDRRSADSLNEILHEYGDYIIGRMGIPYREKGINVISIAVDAPQDVISALSGKIGKLDDLQDVLRRIRMKKNSRGSRWAPAGVFAVSFFKSFEGCGGLLKKSPASNQYLPISSTGISLKSASSRRR